MLIEMHPNPPGDSGEGIIAPVAREFTQTRPPGNSEPLESALRMMARKEEEIHRYKTQLERVNRELVQTNQALSVMARNMDNKRHQLVQQITHTVSSRILPAIEEMQHIKMPEKYRVQLDVIRTCLNELIPDAAVSSGVTAALSKTELRVAVMIRNGFSTLEISRMLNLSDLTVKTHRRNIRRKLKMSNSKINLSTYLKLKLGNPRLFIRATREAGLGELKADIR